VTVGRQTREQLLASFWQAFAHPIRLRILEHLRTNGAQNVGQLAESLHMGQGHLSNHLACLRQCGLVEADPQGRFVYYRIADNRIAALLDLGSAVLQEHLDGVAACSVVRPTREASLSVD